MVGVSTQRWGSLEEWSQRLFFLAAVVLLVAAVNYAIPFLVDSIAFNDAIGLTVLIGRLASLFAVAGLTVRIMDYNPRVGKLSRVVVALAVLFTIGLLTFAVLEQVGYTTDIIAVFGLGTVLLSILTYALLGIGIIRTGAYSPVIGGLLLLATAALLFGFFAQMTLSEQLVGTVAEAGLFLSHLGIWYSLVNGGGTPERAEPAAEAAP